MATFTTSKNAAKLGSGYFRGRDLRLILFAANDMISYSPSARGNMLGPRRIETALISPMPRGKSGNLQRTAKT
jgi:hypothetical protein